MPSCRESANKYSARAVLVLALLALSSPARGQLISPGKLSSAHEELEGVRACTNCHELRKTGVSNAKCLSCHDALAARITAGRGYHAKLAQPSCAECHAEHFGREFKLVRLDPDTFDHARTGYTLETGHARVECRTCHQADRIEAVDVRSWTRTHGNAESTYLGLANSCTACHGADDPHKGQFAKRACTICHNAVAW